MRGLVDREAELQQLHSLLQAGEPRLALLSGRRRVGKTFLLTNAWSSEVAFYFCAANTSPDINRKELIEELSRWSGEELRPQDYPTWRAVFNLLLEVRAPEPIVLILDEFQYLANDEAGLAQVASELNAAWERRRPVRPLVLVLAGSAISMMEGLASGGAPLYGRFNFRKRLLPFDYWHTARMLHRLPARDAALAYAIFGGIPRYLAPIDQEQGLAQNVTRLLLAPEGEVRQLVESAIEQEEGLRDISSYRGILRAVANGRVQRNEIALYAGLSNDNALVQKLEKLIELGYLAEAGNFAAARTAPRRYRITDQAFRFHQRFVEPNMSLLQRSDPADVWTAIVAPQLDTYMGLEFERIAVQAYDRQPGNGGRPLVQQWSRWEGVDRSRKSLEIDLVAPLVDGRMLTGAVKWNRRPVSLKLHFDHLGMLERAALAGQGWAHDALSENAVFYYVSAAGFADGFEEVAAERGHEVICWSLEDLYAPG